jgi:hypothetical protein
MNMFNTLTFDCLGSTPIAIISEISGRVDFREIIVDVENESQ